MDFNDSSMRYFISIIMVILIMVLLSKFKNKRRRKLANQIPGPEGSFIIGSLSLLLQKKNFLKNALKEYKLYEKSLYKLWIFNRLYIVLTQPKDIEFVLTHPNLQRKAKEYSIMQQSFFGQGIFSIDDIKKWKINRKTVTKGFSISVLKSFIPMFYEEANVLSEILQKKCESESKECDISVPINLATMEMIGKTSFGVKFNAQSGIPHPFVEHLHIALHTWKYRLTHPWFLSKTLFQLTSLYRKLNKSHKFMYKFTDEIIKRKFNELNQNSNCEKKVEIIDDNTCQKPKTVIEMLLGKYHEMSHEQVRDEILTIIIGGQETTATTIPCILFMLAHHQDVQKKVYKELQSIFSTGNPDRSPTYDDLCQMNYLEQVIKETLRLIPPLPIIGRRLEEEIHIGDYLCPAGATLLIFPACLHLSSQNYTNPEKFNPDNFLPDKFQGRHPYSYIPFSAGPRNCIGIKYSMFQIKIVVSTLLRKNKFSPADRCPTPENLKLMFLMVLKFVNGCYVKIEPRMQ